MISSYIVWTDRHTRAADWCIPPLCLYLQYIPAWSYSLYPSVMCCRWLGREPEQSLLMGKVQNKAEVLFDEPCMGTWWPSGMLPGRERESWSLYLSVLYPIRVSPSITPSIQRMRTAFTKLQAPSCPLFTLLTAALSSSSLPSLSSLLSSSPQSLPHTFTLFSLSFSHISYHPPNLMTKQAIGQCLPIQLMWPFSNLVFAFTCEARKRLGLD